MKKLLLLTFVLTLITSCQTLPKDPYSVVGSWQLVDTDIDVQSESATTDRIIRTAFAAYTTLGGGMDKLSGTVTFDKKGRCQTPKFACDYTQYGTTLSLKYKLLNAAGVNTKFAIERQMNELYLTYDAKETISQLGIGLDDKALNAIQKANIVLIFRRK